MASPFFAILLLALATVPGTVRSQNTPCSTDGSLCTDKNSICFNSKCVPFVGLGGACSIIDVCYNKPDATLKLACVSNKCLIQAGQTCASNADKCVTGAACNTSSLCSCTPGYRNWQSNNAFMSNECKRQAKIGEDCSDHADCVSDDNGPDIKCDPYKLTCAIKADKACTSGNAQYCTTGSTCQSSRCTCNPPYTNEKGMCSKTISTVGGVCGREDKCKNENPPVHMRCDHQSLRDAVVRIFKTYCTCQTGRRTDRQRKRTLKTKQTNKQKT
ncbi:prion-like-(Q/N-rich) domain-bearing protein 25 isoform X1 [Littorina saxatilis]|uniref:prion-like-(Q/N-rich) domain-bearing protein 25 isoform X1 n=1 Tax=Littorina saxatilis TaxID=31220 RepID=UPI0038B4D44E